MTYLGFNLPENLHSEFKDTTEAIGTTMTEVLKKSVRDYVAAKKKQMEPWLSVRSDTVEPGLTPAGGIKVCAFADHEKPENVNLFARQAKGKRYFLFTGERRALVGMFQLLANEAMNAETAKPVTWEGVIGQHRESGQQGFPA